MTKLDASAVLVQRLEEQLVFYRKQNAVFRRIVTLYMKGAARETIDRAVSDARPWLQVKPAKRPRTFSPEFKLMLIRKAERAGTQQNLGRLAHYYGLDVSLVKHWIEAYATFGLAAFANDKEEVKLEPEELYEPDLDRTKAALVSQLGEIQRLRPRYDGSRAIGLVPVDKSLDRLQEAFEARLKEEKAMAPERPLDPPPEKFVLPPDPGFDPFE